MADLPTSWRAAWVCPTAEPTPAGRRPAYRLRGTFEAAGPVRQATLFATAHGIYEAELNGVRVGDDELTPGYTEYQHHAQVQSYDVTGLLREGQNTLDALLADGWYRGQVGITRASDQWGTETAFLGQLEVEHEDGAVTVVRTDRHRAGGHHRRGGATRRHRPRAWPGTAPTLNDSSAVSLVFPGAEVQTNRGRMLSPAGRRA